MRSKWHPREVWYRIACWAWYRYTTVKPRYLDHTWHDRCDLLPHVMFEVLSDFIENEDHRWTSEGTVVVQGIEKNVDEELEDIYEWWHEIYNKFYEEVLEKNAVTWAKVRPLKSSEEIGDTGFIIYSPNYKSVEDEAEATRSFEAFSQLDDNRQRELGEMMHRLIAVKDYMWV